VTIFVKIFSWHEILADMENTFAEEKESGDFREYFC
jgi:hypothetical protein